MKFTLSLVFSLSIFTFSLISNAQILAHSNPGVGNIVITGDSLAAGLRATDPKVTPEGCLSTLPNTGVYNFSIKGQTSDEILLRNSRVLAQKPALVFVSSGGNDAIHNVGKPGSYPREKTLAEMDMMLTELINSGALVVYLGLEPNIAGAQRLPEISKMAATKGAIVVDGMRGFWGKRKYMADAIHPNNAGYKIMCDRILLAIKGHYP